MKSELVSGLKSRNALFIVSAIALGLISSCSLSSSSDSNPTAATGSMSTISLSSASPGTDGTSAPKVNSTIAVIGNQGKVLKADRADLEAGLAGGIGSNAPNLVYASEERIIFNAYFGLFVYDLTQKAITTSLDLEKIGCSYTQGDSVCEIEVSKDGQLIQLHRADSDTMFIFHLKMGQLTGDVPYEKMADPFRIKPLETTPLGVGPKDWPSSNSVLFQDGTVAYLKVPNGVLADLVYIRGTSEVLLFPHPRK